MIKQTCLILALTALGCASAPSGPPSPLAAKQKRADGVSDQQRLESATKELKAEPQTLAFFAKGMCCQSCAIGVRIHVASMTFVDQSRFNKGVKLNALTQVVTVALKEGQTVHPQALKVAVQRAGYEPVEMYQLVDGNVERKPLN